MMEFIHSPWGTIIIWGLLAPSFLAWLVSWLGERCKMAAVQFFGYQAQFLLGGLGIIIHELSHLIMALLFHHQLTDVRLLRRPDPNDPTDNALGYVAHRWNQRSWYQTIGNFWIGVAPIIGCLSSLVAIIRYLTPSWYNTLISTLGTGNLVVANHTPWWQYLLAILLIIQLSVGGFDLSLADWQNSKAGLIATAVSIGAVLALSNWLWGPVAIQAWLNSWMPLVNWLLCFASLINGLVLLLFYCCYLFKN